MFLPRKFKLAKISNDFDEIKMKGPIHFRNLLKRKRYIILILDIIVSVTNFFVLLNLVWEHNLLVEQNYQLNESINNRRLIHYAISLFQCVLLILRNYQCRVKENIEYALQIRISSN